MLAQLTSEAEKLGGTRYDTSEFWRSRERIVVQTVCMATTLLDYLVENSKKQRIDTTDLNI